MALALRLARKARGCTSPNPMVGAIVVAGKKIVGQGFHRRAGEDHAERIALQKAGKRAHGATLYVTLEPCTHTNKKTPPCVPLVLESAVRRVVVAMRDPNPLVSGRGVRRLRREGIRVDVGCLGEAAEHLNEFYCHWIRTGQPFVVLKAAMTLDGKIATARGESQWITSEGTRSYLHRLRSQVDALIVGIGTVLRDDPQLTARRMVDGGDVLATRQPLRVILDSRLRIPLTAKVLARLRGTGLKGTPGIRTLIATTSEAETSKLRRLRSLGVPVLILPYKKGRPSLRACLTHLGRMGITSVMIEGGSELNASAISTRLVNRVLLFVAPTIMGGQDAKSVIGGHSPRRLSDVLRLDELRTRRIGRDLLIEGNLLKKE